MTCEGCKYWSERIAEMDHESGEILAMCLHPETPRAPSGMPPMVYRGCDRYAPGEPIDLREFSEDTERRLDAGYKRWGEEDDEKSR